MKFPDSTNSHSLPLIKVWFSYDIYWCDYTRSNLNRSLTIFPASARNVTYGQLCKPFANKNASVFRPHSSWVWTRSESSILVSCASSLVNCNEMRSGSGREVNSRWTSNSSREALLIYSTPMNLARSPCAKLLTNRILIWTWSNWL